MKSSIEFIKTKEDLLNYIKKYQKKTNKNPFFNLSLNQCIFQDGSKLKDFSRDRS